MRLAAGLRPDPLGELKRSPRSPSRKRGPTSKGRGREGKGEGRGEKRKEREGRKRGSGGEEKGEGRGGKRRGREGKGEGRGPSGLVANEAFSLKSASDDNQRLKWFGEPWGGGSPDEARLEQTPYPFQTH